MDGKWDYKAYADSLKVIASEARLEILFRLLDSPHSRKELMLKTRSASPTLRHHLERLSRAGVIALDASGNYYACGEWIEIDGRRAWRISLPLWYALFFVEGHCDETKAAGLPPSR